MTNLYRHLLITVMCLTLLGTLDCLDNGLALTPPMGWMSWQRYRCTIDCDLYPDECISEWLFRNVTDLLVSEGYAAVGYKYVIIDDCWLAPARDDKGRLQPDPRRFPSGIKALADYVHSKGLKFGIYEDYGTKTCAGYPGILGNLKIDAETFADWEVDYIKLDGCNADPNTYDKGYPEFGNYLNSTGRPIVYSCSWPAYLGAQDSPINFSAIAKTCNLWRLYDDIDDSWQSVFHIMQHFGQREDLIQYAGPGHWNDPDMLVIGNFGLSEAQSQAQMAVWAVLAAPLIMSNNLAHISPWFKNILQNKRIIAVNQDALGIQGRLLFAERGIHVWVRPILPKVDDYYSYAVAFVSNRTDGTPYPYSVSLKKLGLNCSLGYVVSNLFSSSHSNAVVKPDASLHIRINPTGVVFLEMKVASSGTLKESPASSAIRFRSCTEILLLGIFIYFNFVQL